MTKSTLKPPVAEGDPLVGGGIHFAFPLPTVAPLPASPPPPPRENHGTVCGQGEISPWTPFLVLSDRRDWFPGVGGREADFISMLL